jgi:phenylalanyl-tRNA synthetase alpha chain
MLLPSSHYPPAGAAREAKYSRYVSDTAMLRTQTSAAIPELLCGVAKSSVVDILLACPGIVYRRDCIDKLHTGEPHQLDLWRLRKGALLTTYDLQQMIEVVVRTLLPKHSYRLTEASTHIPTMACKSMF